MRHPPDKERSRPPGRKGGPDTNTATNGPTIIDDRADPRRVGELLGDWLAIRMDEVDALVAEAQDKVKHIPDRRVLIDLFGELLLTVRALEHEVAELKAARR